LKSLIGLCVLAFALSGCLAKTRYDLPADIGLSAQSLAAAQQASRQLEQELAVSGDFKPGDLVRLSFPYLPTLDSEQRVQASGYISPPLLGPIQTNGQSAADLQALLQRLYRPKLERPIVSVSVVEFNRRPEPPQVFVIGEVIRPGAVEFRAGASWYEALARAGGANRQANLRRVVVITPARDHLQARLVDLQAPLSGPREGGRGEIGYVAPNSIIIVPPTNLVLSAERSETIRRIIGFSGFNTSFRIVN
jgi:protein involved in polysaccharide export with SLBB domain